MSKSKKNCCKGVLLLVDGNIKDINIPLKEKKQKKNNLNSIKIDNDIFENIGESSIENIGEWELDTGDSIIAFGFTKGEQENNHELLPLDNILSKTSKYYGDIILLKLDAQRNIVNINSNSYEEIYTNCYSNIAEESDEDIQIYNNEEESSNSEEEYEEESDLDNEEEDKEEEEEVQLVDESLNSCNVEQINETRKQIISLFKKILTDNQAQTLEKSILDYTISTSHSRNIATSWDNEFFKKIYINKSRSLFSNLKSDSYIKNTYLLKSLKKNTLNIKDIPELSFQALFPSHWKKIMDEKHNRDKWLYEDQAEAMTDQFRCGRCKSRECSYYELQTRSADESMTIFITCIKCGNRWRQ